VTLGQFLGKQFIRVIEWNEPDNEGKIADIFSPGLHTLNTRNLPLLTDLMNWDKAFESPFKSEVYFFSTRLQVDQKWGTATPITIREKEFGAVRLRCYGIYSYRIADPRAFFNQISGTRDHYYVTDLEGQLRDAIVARISETLAMSEFPFLDMTANLAALGDKLVQQMKPAFSALGLELSQFAVQNISLPDELQKLLDQRIGMSMVGDLGRYTQFAAAEGLDIAAANTGGGAGIGMGLGAGAAVAQVLSASLKTPAPGPPPLQPTPGQPSQGATDTKFCIECGKPIPQRAKFCAECGKPQ